MNLSSLFNIFRSKNPENEWERKLPLIKVYTFPDGQTLHTYRIEDLKYISYRHYSTISEIQAYLEAFGQLPYEFKIAMNEMKESNLEAISNPNKIASALAKNVNFIDHFLETVKGIRDTNKILEDEMLCMFYVLGDERECGYSEAINEKKKALFDANPELRAFFLSKAPKASDIFKVTSRIDIRETLSKIMSLKHLIQFTK